MQICRAGAALHFTTVTDPATLQSKAADEIDRGRAAQRSLADHQEGCRRQHTEAEGGGAGTGRPQSQAEKRRVNTAAVSYVA